jgi:hypothetical protein
MIIALPFQGFPHVRWLCSFSKSALRELAQAALDHARHAVPAPAKSTSPKVSANPSACAARKSKPSNTTATRDLGVTVYLGQRRGHASSSDFSLAALAATVDAALSIARFTAEDDCAGLPEAAAGQARHGPRPVPPLGYFRRGRDRHRPPLRTGGLRRQSDDPQFRGGVGVGAAVAFCLRQQPGLHGWLRHLATLRLVLGDRRRGRGHAARRLVCLAPQCRRISRCRRIGDYAARRALSRLVGAS